MIKVCDYPCNSKREADKNKKKYMIELKANMNSMRSFITEEEKKEREKQYREIIRICMMNITSNMKKITKK